MFRCMFVILLLFPLYSKSSDQVYIDWLARLPEQGIAVSAEHWQQLAKKPSRGEVREIVRTYLKYIDRGRLDQGLFQPGWHITDSERELPESQELSIKLLSSMEPKIPAYQTLKKALGSLREWQSEAVSRFPDDLIFFEGDRHPAIKSLNQWLYDLDLADQLDHQVYTQAHKDVLTQVQLRFDLGPDGRLGVLTRQALLAITNERIRVLKANLERIRWLPPELPYPHLRVDIAGYNVAWVKNRKEQVRHKAIVGRKEKQTPVFNDEVESITYNPVWKVPHSIAAHSMLRAEKKEPGFLKKEGFVVYKNWDDNAPRVDIDSIQWKSLTPRTFRYRLEQQPGVLNRLGKFKLDLPNGFGVYLHDTDKPELFDERRRLFSSGCTRVQGIEQLINHIVATQPVDKVMKLEEKGQGTIRQHLNQTVPIYFVYFTAWPDETGRVRFRDDIYQLDNALVSWF